jgi:hypothetical protein
MLRAPRVKLLEEIQDDSDRIEVLGPTPTTTLIDRGSSHWAWPCPAEEIACLIV